MHHGNKHGHHGAGSSQAAAITGVDNAQIAGTAGNDRIVASANDTLTGGGGHDEFVIGAASGATEITDFDLVNAANASKIDLRHSGVVAASFADLKITEDASGNAIVDLGNGNSLKLDKTDMTLLTAGNFELPGQGGKGGHHGHGHHHGGGDHHGSVTAIRAADNVAVTGTSGNDHIVAGANDTITGGGGNDEFVLGAASGSTEITDFNLASGIIDLKHSGVVAGSMADLKITEDASGNAIIDLGNGNTLTLDNVDMTKLAAANFELPSQGSGQGGDHGGNPVWQNYHIVQTANLAGPITAAAGPNLFNFTAEHGPVASAEISNFMPSGATADLIRLDDIASVHSFADLKIADNAAGNAVIDLGNNVMITLDNVHTSALSAADFVFG